MCNVKHKNVMRSSPHSALVSRLCDRRAHAENVSACGAQGPWLPAPASTGGHRPGHAPRALWGCPDGGRSPGARRRQSCVQTLFCTKTPCRFSRSSATRYAAEMCIGGIGVCVHCCLEIAICGLCRHDTLCGRAPFGFLLAIKDVTPLWRQQFNRRNDVNSDNQQLGPVCICSLIGINSNDDLGIQ